MLTTEGARMAASASKQLVDADVRALRWHLKNLSGVLATASKLAGFSFFFSTFMLGTPGIKLNLHTHVVSGDVAFAAVAAMLAATCLFVLAAVISLVSGIERACENSTTTDNPYQRSGKTSLRACVCSTSQQADQ